MRISTFVCLALLLALLSSCSSVAFRSEIEEQVSTWAVNGDRRYKDIKIDVHDNDGQFASGMVSVQLDSRRDEEEDWWELEFDFECKRPADEWQCLVDLKDGGNVSPEENADRQEEGNYRLLLEPSGDDRIISVSFCDEDTILALDEAGKAYVIDVPENTVRYEVGNTSNGESSSGSKDHWRVLCHADSNRFYVVNADGLTSGELSSGAKLETLQAANIALSSDGSKMALSGTKRTGLVDIIQTQSGKRLSRVRVESDYLPLLAFDPTGKYIAVGEQSNYGDRNIEIFVVSSGENVGSVPTIKGYNMVMVPKGATYGTERTHHREPWIVNTDFPFSIATSGDTNVLPLSNGKEYMLFDHMNIILFPRSSDDISRDGFYWNRGEKYTLNSHQSFYSADVWVDEIGQIKVAIGAGSQVLIWSRPSD